MINGTEDEETLKRLDTAQAAACHIGYVRILETLHGEIDTLLSAAGSLGDYIDLGRPDPDQKEKAFNKMQEHDKSAGILIEKLKGYVSGFREYCPEVITLWAGVHIRVCRFFLDTLPAKSENEKTARFVARSILEAWERFKLDGDEFISTDTPWLTGYHERVEYELSAVTPELRAET